MKINRRTNRSRIPRKQKYRGAFTRRMMRYWARMERAYVPGKLGISAVSEFIMQDYGAILSRRGRKRLAKEQGIKFVGYRSY